MKRLLCLLIVVMFVIGFGLTLVSCTKISDELVLQKIKSAKEPSDLFQAICVGTKADTAQIRRLATSLHWDEQPLSQDEKNNFLTGNWRTKVNNTGFVIATSKGFDPKLGRMELCVLSYGGNVETAFIQNVINKSGLRRVKAGSQRVTPDNQIETLPSDSVLLTDTGEWGNFNFMVTPFDNNFFGIRTAMAMAIKLSK